MQGSDGEKAGKESTGTAGLVPGIRLLRKSAQARRALTASLHNADVQAYNACSGSRTPLMGTLLLRASLLAILAGTFGLQPAYADIYTWVDASGVVNVSNLAPPENVRVTNVIHASAPKITTRDDANRDAARHAEVQALTERVRQLENEVALARSKAPTTEE